MLKYSILIVLFAVTSMCVAQKGYNYPPPSGDVGVSTIRPGFPGTAGFPVRPGVQADTPIGPGYGETLGLFPNGPETQPPYGGGFPGAFPGRPIRPGVQADTPTGPGFPSPGIGGSRPGQIRPTGPINSGGPARPVGGFQGGRPIGSGGQFPSQSNNGFYEEGDYSAIPGQPGADYPIYTEIPQTSFDCSQQQFPGYYADVETECQVFHVCAMNRTFDFLCPNGTIFSQETLVCVWWNQFDCASAIALYPNNAFIYDYSQNGQNSQQQRPIGGGGFPGSQGVGFQGGQGAGFPGSGTIGTQRPPSTGFAQRPPNSGVSRPIQGGRPVTNRPNGPAGFPQGPVGGYPTGPTGPTGPSSGYPSAVGGYPGAGAPSGPAFPSGPGAFGTTSRPGFPANVQGDVPFPPTILPPTPNREYLPPRRI